MDTSREIHDQLILLSEKIDQFIANRDENAPVLDELENWTKSQFERLTIRKLRDSKAVAGHENKPWREDAIFIFDESLKIIHYSGLRNYFTGQPSHPSSEISMLDFIDEAEHDLFYITFLRARKEHKSVEVELHLKTGTHVLNKCRVLLDMSASCSENQRYVACLRMPDNMEHQISEYQSILFDNLPGMDVFLFDRDYRYIISGGREKERYQFTNSDFIGNTLFDVYDKKTLRSFFPFYNKALNGETTEGEVRFKNDIYYLIATPIHDFRSNVIAGMLISQNVTNDKLVEEQLKKGKEDAQKADRAKSIFIANMSHEIRTPLSAIVGFTEQLEKTELTLQQARYLSLIKKASDHLLYLVSEIVFLFKLGMGKVYLEKRPFSLDELIAELNDLFSAQATEKKLAFRVEKDHTLPPVLLGDPFRLKQILMNLLVNAIKYTDKGTVELRCRNQRETKKKVTVSFQIEDTGVGISERDLPNIFNVFEQGEKLNASIRGGAGLGLGICHRLVNLLGGDISVTSELHRGSVFTVSLPFEKKYETVVIKDEKQFDSSGEHLAGKKILLADDDEHNIMLAGLILKNWKTDYVLVENGAEALDAFERTRFDVVLLDIHMGCLSGEDVIRAVRARRRGLNWSTPAIAVTANAMKSDISRYLKSGFNDYLIKPYKEVELYNKLCNVLTIEPSEAEKSSGFKLLHTSLDNVLNTGELQQLANGDHDFVTTMINNFINNSKNLKNVLEINLLSGNWEEVGERVHKAIPSFRYFGLLQIASRLEMIEELALRKRSYSDLPALMQESIHQIDKVVSQATVKDF